MLTRNEVMEICNRLSMENAEILDYDIAEEISSIVYRIDVYITGNERIICRHVDLEYSYGEYYEICEDNALFEYISTVCYLPLLQEDQEIVIYQSDSNI